MVAKREGGEGRMGGGEGRMGGEFRTNRGKLLYLGWINKVLLYSTVVNNVVSGGTPWVCILLLPLAGSVTLVKPLTLCLYSSL